MTATQRDQQHFGDFQAVYERTFRLVLFVLRKLSVPECEVEEMAQEVYLAFYKHGHTVDPTKVNAWLAIAARNLAFDAFRKNRVRKERRSEAAEYFALDSIHGIEECQHGRDADAISDFLRVWSDKYPKKSALAEFYLHGKSVKQIGEERGMRVSSVTSALTRQRREFRASVESTSSSN